MTSDVNSRTSPRFKKMNAQYPGSCIHCFSKITAGDLIYYCKQDGGAMCYNCGMEFYEANLLNKVLNVVSSVSLSEIPVSTVPLTLSAKCYCARIKRTCGFCVSKLMETRICVSNNIEKG